MLRIGILSDTHGLLRPEAVSALSGVDRIVHAGDIGSMEIITALNEIAPVTAVRGNNDVGSWARTIPLRSELKAGSHRIYVLHDIAELDINAADYAAVISGHSHRPAMHRRDGVLFLNPGSAGPRRFKLPVSVAFLRVSTRGVQARIRELQIQPAAAARARR